MDAVTNSAKAHTLKTEALLKYEVDKRYEEDGHNQHDHIYEVYCDTASEVILLWDLTNTLLGEPKYK